MPSVVVFGASGFVGAPYILALKQAHPDWSITAFVRSTKAESELRAALHADRIVVGDFTEADKISALSAEHDIAVNAGNSFTSEPVASIIAGLRKKGEKGAKGKLVHISGAGNFLDFGTSGIFNADSKVWTDSKDDDIKAIHKDMFNGQSDTLVLEAGAENAVETYIICPGVVYGGASVDAPAMGVGYNLIIGNARPLGYVPYVGDGTAVVSTTHVLDLISFLVTITAIAGSSAVAPDSSSYSRFYMLETARVQWKDVATELAKVMHKRGVFASAEPKSVPFEQAGEGEVKYLVAGNMLIQPERAKALGWAPQGASILTQMHKDLSIVPL